MTIIQKIADHKVIAVIRLDDLSQAVQLSQALIAGNVHILEFTLTNPDAANTIATVREAVGEDGIIGAGSVISVEQVELVAKRGAQFVVSPVTKRDVIEACHKYALPTVPGAYTPTEIQTAWEMDVTAVKVFPAGRLGPGYIKDLLAPLPHLRLIPTGGINGENIRDYIQTGVFAAGVGSALFDTSDLLAGNWEAITKSARALVDAIQT
ncbi:MAG: bifunctional 4-hydroxy-2-oxoglutarate aldolase/2-dehydro-3-deoxy-phosphogluconate aldolase [Aggregatilineales bacterium]